MFSVAQKRHIAEVLEKTLLELQHPEMPTSKPSFSLHVDGAESWSFADIRPNWEFDDNNKPGVNPWNEAVAAQMNKERPASA